MPAPKEILKKIFDLLYERFGPQHWWPAQTPLEVIIGAILTQNTAWQNVERAITNLKRNNLLEVKALKEVSLKRLSTLIKPSGYYNQKAKKIKNFIQFLFKNYEGSIKKMFQEDFLVLRAKLLNIKGIGLETADSILLYAGNKPIFVVDAYTRRILTRHNLIRPDSSYNDIQNYFMDNLESDVKLFNEYHALLVRLGKEFCKTKPDCNRCPLKDIDTQIEYRCDSCEEQLPKPQDRYVLEIKLYASPEVEITEDDLKKNPQEEIKRIIEETKDIDKERLEEEVFVSYNLILCKRCRDIFNARLKHREFV